MVECLAIKIITVHQNTVIPATLLRVAIRFPTESKEDGNCEDGETRGTNHVWKKEVDQGTKGLKYYRKRKGGGTHGSSPM